MADLSQKVEIGLSCNHLKNADAGSKSDPFVVLTDTATGKEVGRTEMIQDDLDPEFVTMIPVTYKFEELQTFEAAVFDYDADGTHDPLGTVIFSLGQLMSSKGSTMTMRLKDGGKATITMNALLAVGGDDLSISFEGTGLKNMDTFGKSDPFFILYRKLDNGNVQRLYKSETVDDNLNPAWKATPSMNVGRICGGNEMKQCLLFRCFDEDTTDNDPMGYFECSVAELEGYYNDNLGLQLKNQLGEKFGTIRIKEYNRVTQRSFVNYIRSGMSLNINISVDMTGSNGNPKNKGSLHHYDEREPNDYIKAMLAISNVVQEYDSDRQFPCFGFGAKIPGESARSDFFNLKLKSDQPYLNGMQEVINTYVETVNRVSLSGPTNFAPTIRGVTTAARAAQGVYTVLLILTDGAITDLDATKNAIVDADDAPLSILMVGIGSADFGKMNFLDADGGPLQSTSGKKSRRDIVQFVAMREFESQPPAALAAALLHEIPTQVDLWAAMVGVEPGQFRKFLKPYVQPPPGQAVVPGQQIKADRHIVSVASELPPEDDE